MQIRLEITEVEIRALQETYAEKSPKPRLSFEEWAGREIASHFSKAWSQKGRVGSSGYVAASVYARNSAATSGNVSGLIIDRLNEAATTAD
jgi:hypothetical protein